MIKEYIKTVLDSLVPENLDYVIEIPSNNFGDYSTNLAMKLSSIRKKSAKDIAFDIVKQLEYNDIFESVEVVGAFINFRLKKSFYISTLKKVDFKRSEKNGSKVLLEFGSINPTGPLHIGHGRVLVIGDVLSSVLTYLGYSVEKEYYINDYGIQIKNLADSLQKHLHVEQGIPVELDEDNYSGSYMVDMAKYYINSNSKDHLEFFAVNYCLDMIKNALSKLSVDYNNWISERTLYKTGALKNLLKEYSKYLYENDGAIFLKTTDFDDDKDRVLIKSNNEVSYFASDLLYSKDKVDRSYDKIITILGSDHHGYIKRYMATFKLRNFDNSDAILVQIVYFYKNNEVVRMSKRNNTFYSLSDLIDEVGKDSCRMMFLSKKADTPINFDIDLALKRNSENPVYYMQYAYARISSLFSKTDYTPNDLDIYEISNPLEINLIKKISEFKSILESIAKDYDTHKLYNYTYDLVSLFHSFYNSENILSQNETIKNLKLLLCYKVQKILKELFNIMNIEILDRM
jgi:arginyl-tRNA synthetase